MTIKTYLGFDVGTKRTGIAIANSLTGHANGIDTVIHCINAISMTCKTIGYSNASPFSANIKTKVGFNCHWSC